MLAALTALASIHLASAAPLARLSDAPPLSMPPIVDIAKYLQQPRPHPFLGDVRENNRGYAKIRHAMRKPLQWGTCDENMTLVGSTCVCSQSFYQAAALNNLVINGQTEHCYGYNSNENLLTSCVNRQYTLYGNNPSRQGWCTITLAPYNIIQTGHIEFITTPLAGAEAAKVSNFEWSDIWFRLDMESTRVVGSIMMYTLLNSPNSNPKRTQLWLGDNSTAYNAAGNVMCYENNEQSMVTEWVFYTWPCLGTGRYLFVYNGFNRPLLLTDFRVNPPERCTMSDCLPCPSGKTSSPGSTSVSDCFVNHGIDINASIVSVDANYSQESFQLPSYMSVANYTDDLDVYLDSCPAGYYCLAESTMPTPCPAGTYRDALGGTESGDCWACPAGSYCPIGSAEPISCPAGRYRGTTGAQQPTDCGLCLTGQFCPQGSVAPQSCLVGTYRDTTGATQAADCPACPAGKFCGSGTSTPSLCAAGTYNDQPGAVTQSDC